MSDIEKLNKVIDTLEEQSVRVTEFNGILDSVNSSRTQIESANEALNDIVNDQKLLISDNYKKFKEFSKELEKQSSRISTLENIQKGIKEDMATLSSLINKSTDKHQYAIRSLQTLLIVFGSVIVIGGFVIVSSL